MHGVPADLDLDPFINTMLERVDFGVHIIHFRFNGPGTVISVEGVWELRDASGSIVDKTSDDLDACFRLPMLAGKTIIAATVNAPDFFDLQFDSGHILRIFDSSSEYESFSVQPGNWFV